MPIIYLRSSEAAALAQRGFVRCSDGKDHAVTAILSDVLIGLLVTYRTFRDKQNNVYASSRKLASEYDTMVKILEEECRRRGLPTVRFYDQSYEAKTCSHEGCTQPPLYRVGADAYCRVHRRIAQMRVIQHARKVSAKSDRAGLEILKQHKSFEKLASSRANLHRAKRPRR